MLSINRLCTCEMVFMFVATGFVTSVMIISRQIIEIVCKPLISSCNTHIQHYCKIHGGEQSQNIIIKLRYNVLLTISSENFAVPLYYKNAVGFGGFFPDFYCYLFSGR